MSEELVGYLRRALAESRQIGLEYRLAVEREAKIRAKLLDEAQDEVERLLKENADLRHELGLQQRYGESDGKATEDEQGA